ncbi:MAG: SRPBCC domain-containing protein [Candidatus Baltobacteraceae bacterium]
MAQIEILADIVESIAIETPIRTVFAALTEPEQVVKWWGSDDSYRIVEMEADLRVGGAWKTVGIAAKEKDRRRNAKGVYRIVDPPRCLEMTFIHDFEGPDTFSDETVVRYDLTEHNGVTTVTLTHSGITNPFERDGISKAWCEMLAWLAAYAV